LNRATELCAILMGGFAALSALAARTVAASVATAVHTVRLMPRFPHATGRHRSGEVCREGAAECKSRPSAARQRVSR
jgi:hypothetical protein